MLLQNMEHSDAKHIHTYVPRLNGCCCCSAPIRVHALCVGAARRVICSERSNTVILCCAVFGIEANDNVVDLKQNLISNNNSALPQFGGKHTRLHLLPQQKKKT